MFKNALNETVWRIFNSHNIGPIIVITATILRRLYCKYGFSSYNIFFTKIAQSLFVLVIYIGAGRQVRCIIKTCAVCWCVVDRSWSCRHRLIDGAAADIRTYLCTLSLTEACIRHRCCGCFNNASWRIVRTACCDALTHVLWAIELSVNVAQYNKEWRI